MLEIVWTIILVMLLFGITIFVHELGHFLVARWLGLTAEVFSIGFGPALWKKKVGDVTYKIGALPLGGYVALPQMDPGGNRPSEEGEPPLPAVAPWRKILVAVAGAAGNVLLAILLAYIIFWVGKPSSPEEWSTEVGYVSQESPAYEAGVRIGHTILTVNGEKVENWNDVALLAALQEQSVLTLETPEGVRTITLANERSPLGVWTVPGIAGVSYCKVMAPMPGSSADRAGILPGDLLLSLGGEELGSIGHLVDLVQQHRGEEVPVTLERGDEVLTLMVTPEYDPDEGRAFIGVQFNTMYVDSSRVVHPTPWSQLENHFSMIFRFLKALVTPKEAKAAAQGVSGPLAIFVMFWWMIKSSFMLALWFTCFLNINLAVLNLLPIPILDGGHVVFSLWEMITRRPVSPKFVGLVSNFFVILLLALFLFLTYRDADRLVLPSLNRDAEEDVQEPEPAPPETEPAAVTP